jgi:hypothetical protein
MAINRGRDIVADTSAAHIAPLVYRTIFIILVILTKIAEAIIISAIHAVITIAVRIALHRLRWRLNRATGTHGTKNEKNT